MAEKRAAFRENIHRLFDEAQAEVEKIPYVLVWGDKESEDAIAVRTHGGEQSTKSLDELRGELRQAASA